jgi:arsenate reductase (thioredoxin)
MSGQGHISTFIEAWGAPGTGTAWDYVITVCGAAFERCPGFPVKTSRLHWSVKDPSSVTGSADEQLDAFRQTRDELNDRIEQ